MKKSLFVVVLSFNWTLCCCCCGSVTPALLSLTAEILHHLLLLGLAPSLLTNTEAALQTLAASVDTKDRSGLAAVVVAVL